MPEEPQTPGDAPQPTLFLSYARADRAAAERLCAALSERGYTLWWDALIEGGAQFAHSIADALDRADAVLVLWSNHSVASDWVRDEAATARDRRRLVPLSLDGSEPPLGFRQYHAIALKDWRGRSDAPEIAAIDRAVAALGTSLPPPPRAAPRRSRRQFIAAGAGAGAAVVGGGLWWAKGHGLLGHAANGHSVAVLPFRNLSGDPAQAYFSAGITEEVRAALRRTAGLKVSAATSSDAVATGKDDATAIAAKLGVAYILEGSVQRAADTVRIAVDLSDGATGFSTWSRTIDRPLGNTFATQGEVAAMVAAAMSVHLATTAPPIGGTTNVAAYERFLRGRAAFNLNRDEATDRAALADFDAAVALDPAFALAHAARSRTLAAIAGESAAAAQLPALYGESIVAARRAIDLAGDLAEGQLAMGFALFTGRLAIAAARPFYGRAYALAAGNADILLLFALYCSRAGRAPDARQAIDQALALDPLNPRTWRAAGSIAYAARRYRDALTPLARALSLNPALSNAHSVAGFCLMLAGDLAGAEREFAAEPHAVFRLAGLAIVRHRQGDAAGARGHYDRLVAEAGDSGLYQQAEVKAQWGDAAAALTALERARAVGDSGLIYLATDPLLDPLRQESRFQRLLKGLGTG